MRHFDLTPLYRSTVGFDRMASLIDSVLSTDLNAPSYPPYNIEKLNDDTYRISIAVAGFAENDLNIESREGQLVVTGGRAVDADAPDEDEVRTYLHRGIAERAFERRFQLADHVRVQSAELENGLLHIDLHREVPEALKPRQIAIGSKTPKAIDV